VEYKCLLLLEFDFVARSGSFQFSRRTLLGAGLFAGTTLLIKACDTTPTQTSAGGGTGEGGRTDLIVTTFAGSWEQLYRDVIVPAFQSAGGGSANLVTMVSLEQVAQLTAAPQNPPFDVALIDEGPFNAASKELFVPIPVEMISNYDQVAPQLLSPDGWAPTTGLQVIGLAYNPSEITTPPTSWEDLYDPQFQGRVSMQGMQTTQGTSVMVQLAKLRGGSESNIEPAFEALEQELKPNLAGLAANSGALATLFQQGEIALAPHDLNNVMALKARGVDIEWVAPQEGAIAMRPSQQIVANTTADLAAAAAFIDASLSLEVQTAMSQEPYNFLPVNRNVELTGLLAEKFGSTLDEALGNLVFLDWSQINPNRSEWIERFDRAIQL
jgi:putative spermidine/putrescine transport system substrate-binding protein